MAATKPSDTFLGLASPDVVLLATQTASSSSSLDFVAFDNATYSSYMFIIENIGLATDNTFLHMRTSTDGGSTYDSGASNYVYAGDGAYHTNTQTQRTSGGDTAINLTLNQTGNAANESWCGTVTVYRPAATEYTHIFAQQMNAATDGTLRHGNVSGWRASAADVDAVQFFAASGNLADGRIKMYGMK